MSTEPQTIALCECGCGQPAPIAPMTRRSVGWVKGQPMRFLKGHNHRKPATDRFWAKVRKSDRCWEWTARLDDGYGSLSIAGRTMGAHRYSYELHIGPIPDGLYVCHRCDNRKCVNPEHLFLGTHQDNMADMYSKGRRPAPIGERNGFSKLTAEQAQAIHDMRKAGATQTAIAAKFGITQALVSLILLGKSWRSVWEKNQSR